MLITGAIIFFKFYKNVDFPTKLRKKLKHVKIKHSGWINTYKPAHKEDLKINDKICRIF